MIQYEAKSVSSDQAARVKIDIPAANYHEQYDVKLVYDTKGISLGEGSGIATVIGDDESIGFVKNPNDHDSQPSQLANLAPEETGAEQMTFTPSDDQTKSETGQLNPKQEILHFFGCTFFYSADHYSCSSESIKLVQDKESMLSEVRHSSRRIHFLFERRLLFLKHRMLCTLITALCVCVFLAGCSQSAESSAKGKKRSIKCPHCGNDCSCC